MKENIKPATGRLGVLVVGVGGAVATTMITMMRVDKPNGDFFYAVPFDTDEIAYMVKIDVKIDDNAQEEDDKDYYDDEIKGADEIQDDANSDDGGGDSDDDVNI